MMSKRARLMTILLALVIALGWTVAPAQAKPQSITVGTVLDAPNPPPDSGDDAPILIASEGDPDELTGGNLSIIENPEPRPKDELNLWQRVLTWLSSLHPELLR